MSVGNRRPREVEQHQEPRRRIGELERRLTRGNAIPTTVLRPCVFSFPGVIVAGVRSGKWKNKNGDSFTLATITCDAAGASDCDVDILVNGSVLFTVSLGSGIDYAEFPASFAIGPTDVIQVETTADGGQTEVTVLLE